MKLRFGSERGIICACARIHVEDTVDRQNPAAVGMDETL